MDFGMYSIDPETVLKWILIGFAVAFFLRDFQKKKSSPHVTMQVSFVIAITLSIILLFLLVAGADNTVVALLGIGGGIVLHLFTVAMYRLMLWIKSKQFSKSKQLQTNSSIAKSNISVPTQLPSD